LADAGDALSRTARMGGAAVPALVAQGRILGARGADHALSWLDTAAERAYRLDEVQWIGPVASARAEYFLLAGEPDRAASEARRGLSLAAAKGHRWLADELAYRLWQATGTGPAAVTAAIGLAQPCAAPPTPYQRLLAGDWAGAADEWAVRGRRYARAEALAAGDRAAVAEALGILDGLGAIRPAQRLRADLRQRGVTSVPRGPRRSSTANPVGLTARQLEVLELLADGLTNADIADRLTLSPKTVEHHISAVLSRLNVTSRGQAIALAHRRRLFS
ncbi:MAG TPA: LuxR C-terminal-related transcriptional regulator, partial [Micromonosporaceae bacterium]